MVPGVGGVGNEGTDDFPDVSGSSHRAEPPPRLRSKGQARPDPKEMHLARPGQSFHLSCPAPWVDSRPGVAVNSSSLRCPGR